MQNFQLAKFYQRLSAFLFDTFIVSVAYGIIIAIITMNPEKILSRFNSTSGNSTVDLIVISIIMIILFVVVPQFNKGMTFGQRFLAIKMIKDNYEETTMILFFIRFIFIAGISVLFLGVPLIVNVYLMLFRKDHKTIQDLLFKTRVIQAR
ncbi:MULTISPECIES: RDD family protein [Bacillaceae]|uniref:RDD family protein n=2 Tax=Gottfriedia acidiceleris TaxID=371036 RepID=A0ABY4JHD2_9BACI|nr:MULTISPECIES: RDD family protein [Bacillaceae]PFH81346.1 RDD family protein [Bacillus sp. AFS088145]PGM54948.1 RDD family protein [Bacillus sp. AFS053548]PGZ91476.1 RDD family protein [Bacillus sp. AFS029533]UPM53234.1 RDD family protein [Gottfriedia acidiceleris]